MGTRFLVAVAGALTMPPEPHHEAEVYRAQLQWALLEARRMHRFAEIVRELYEDAWDMAREEMLERWPGESEVTDADDFAVDAVAKLGLEVVPLLDTPE